MKTRIGLVVSVALALVALLALVAFTTPGEAAPILQQGGTCFVEITGDNATDYSSADASALQDALDALAPTSDTVKVAGTCAGVQNVGGYTQTLYIDESNLTIQGGYTPTAWRDDPDPVAYPTVLDAQGAGRVVYFPFATAVSSVTLDGFHIKNGDAANNVVGNCGQSASTGGGGICLSNVTNVTVRNSIIYENTAGSGGGLYQYGGLSVYLINTSVMSNTSTGSGGGIFHANNALYVQESTISGNSASGEGGGIFFANHNLSITNSTISGNSASNGGGIRVGGTSAIIEASTIASNTATDNGGGIYELCGTVTFTNTILAYNSDTNNSSSPDCYGTINAGGYNLFQDTAGCTLAGTHNLTGTDPLLDPLTDNGGPSTGSGQATWTHALQNDSPAIDAGSNVDCSATDQRGELRDDLRCDIGAYELRYDDNDTVIKDSMKAGTQASFGPTLISVTVTSGDAGMITVTKHLTAPGGVADDAGEMAVTWYINASDGPYTVTLALCYTDAEVAGLAESDMWAYRWDGTNWVNMYGDPHPTNNCVTVANVGAFSAWTLYDYTAEGTPTVVSVRRFRAQHLTPGTGVVGLTTLALGALYVTIRRRRET
jgi:hypothetical protein